MRACFWTLHSIALFVYSVNIHYLDYSSFKISLEAM